MRPLHTIAREISHVWPKPYFGAVPYLRALFDLDDCTDDYCMDSARNVVLYFLSNAKTWRGPDARRIKAELLAHLKA
jgi:hypothetical protein